MKRDREEEIPPPRKWLKVTYRVLATGKYAALWLPELLNLYARYVSDEGEDAANEWLMRELIYSVGPSISGRVYKILRTLYATWKVYRRLAGD